MAGLMDEMDGYTTADLMELMRRQAMIAPPPPADWRSNMDAPAPGYDQRTGMSGPPRQAVMTEAGPYAAARPFSERAMNAVADYGPLPAQLATAIAMQPVTAGRAAGVAAAEPTLANITDAGVQTALAAFRPLAAAKVLGAGYGAAVAKDAGAFNVSAQAEGDGLTAGQRQRLDALQKKQNRGNSLTRAEREEQNSYLSIQATALSAKAQAEAATNAERARLEAEAEAKRKSSELAEYERSVGVAEKARDTELARANRFSDSEVGKVYAKTGIVTPALAAMGAGGLAKAALGAKAGHSPLIAGLGTGAATAHYPLAHDAMLTPAYNPERAGYEAYARELPPTHPRKQEWQDYARGLPEANPSREAASKELYNPMKFGERTAIGLLEGLVSGPAGAHMVDIARRAPRSVAATSAEAVGNVARGAGALPGLMSEAGYLQGAKTQGARGLYERARADADLSSQVAASAPRPSALTGGLLDDVAEMPRSPRPVTSAPSPQPQPAPVQSLPPPSREPRVKEGSDWQLYHSAPAKAAIETHLKSGAPLSALTEPKLRELMAPLLGKGVEPPAKSTLRQYLQGLKDDAGSSIATANDARKFFKQNPGAFSILGPAIGAGGVGLMAFDD